MTQLSSAEGLEIRADQDITITSDTGSIVCESPLEMANDRPINFQGINSIWSAAESALTVQAQSLLVLGTTVNGGLILREKGAETTLDIYPIRILAPNMPNSPDDLPMGALWRDETQGGVIKQVF